ncbi:MAG: hypothetical protein VX938_03905, partial [Myxococcota bacterium]|nr:hypothetical protein [Myxococcota bacterium]
LETHGPEPFLDVYADGDFHRAYGQPLDELVRGWEAFLEDVELRDHARELARRRFAAPGVFYRVCALEIAQLRQGISEALEREDLEGALRLQEEILSHSSESIDVHLTYVALLARSGDREATSAAVRAAEAVPGLDAVATTRLRELEADGLWRAGETARASTLYGELIDAPQARHRRRNVAVKSMVAGDPELEPILGPYLLGASGDRETWEPYLTDAVADLPDRVLPLYLLGRRLLFVGDADKGARLLRAALEVSAVNGVNAGLVALPMIRQEAQWLLGWALVETGSYQEAAKRLARQADLAEGSGRRLQLQTWADYARWLSKQTSDLK